MGRISLGPFLFPRAPTCARPTCPAQPTPHPSLSPSHLQVDPTCEGFSHLTFSFLVLAPGSAIFACSELPESGQNCPHLPRLPRHRILLSSVTKPNSTLSCIAARLLILSLFPKQPPTAPRRFGHPLHYKRTPRDRLHHLIPTPLNSPQSTSSRQNLSSKLVGRKPWSRKIPHRR